MYMYKKKWNVTNHKRKLNISKNKIDDLKHFVCFVPISLSTIITFVVALSSNNNY